MSLPIAIHQFTPQSSIEFQQIAAKGLREKDPHFINMSNKHRVAPKTLRSKKAETVTAARHKNEFERHGGDTRQRLRAKLANK